MQQLPPTRCNTRIKAWFSFLLTEQIVEQRLKCVPYRTGPTQLLRKESMRACVRAVWHLLYYYARANAKRRVNYTAVHEGGFDNYFLDAQTRDVGGLLASDSFLRSNIK
jgi:hypothetical protein